MPAGRLSSQVGGPINYSFFSFWVFMGFAGFAITLGSLSALQHYENKTGLSDGPTGGWCVRLPVLYCTPWQGMRTSLLLHWVLRRLFIFAVVGQSNQIFLR